MLGYEYVLSNASLLTAKGEVKRQQSIVIQDGCILWCGDDIALPPVFEQSTRFIEDCQGRLVTPGLIDCHTHLVYAGERVQDYCRKLHGETYEQIAKTGGGILNTVKATRMASYETLVQLALPRIKAMREQGVTTVEVKSGYGLDFENELKMLRVAKTIGQLAGVRVVTTFLGAHTLPPEFQGNSLAYVDFVCNEMMPYFVAEGLIDAVDVFCESIGFDLAMTEKIFLKAQALNIPVKCHSEQLSYLGSASLASSFHALSCDHLEYLDERGIQDMAQSQTTAVLLPGAYYFTGQNKMPPVHALRKAKVPMAIATDCNPGTSPTTSLPLMMHMACRLYGLSVEEAWMGVTSAAALALGLFENIGELAAGKVADLVRWSTQDPADLCYYFGQILPHDLMVAGVWSTK